MVKENRLSSSYLDTCKNKFSDNKTYDENLDLMKEWFGMPEKLKECSKELEIEKIVTKKLALQEYSQCNGPWKVS